MFQLVYVNGQTSSATTFALDSWRFRFLGLGITLVVISLLWFSFRLGHDAAYENALQQPAMQAWHHQLEQQQEEVASAKQQAQAKVTALAKKVAELQSHLLRLNALGERLVDISDLDPNEFDFDKLPGMGGPDEADVAPRAYDEKAYPNFLASLGDVEEQVASHERQFTALESIYRQHQSLTDTYIQGRPVAHGWISSFYGKRTDPFHGRQAWHAGIDIAGKEGSEVFAVASGIVTHAARRSGYGNLVEVDHGNGYVTRYAHNKSVEVKPGELVEKGQILAKMGSTGRSTGPHVHFEVLKDGRTRNPIRYINRRAI